MSSIAEPFKFYCQKCATDNGLAFDGLLFYGQCDYCECRWVTIIESDQPRDGTLKTKCGGGDVQERLRHYQLDVIHPANRELIEEWENEGGATSDPDTQ